MLCWDWKKVFWKRGLVERVDSQGILELQISGNAKQSRNPWIIKFHGRLGVLTCHPVTSRPLSFPQKEVVLSPCHFASTHLTASILRCYLPLTSQHMKWRTLSQP